MGKSKPTIGERHKLQHSRISRTVAWWLLHDFSYLAYLGTESSHLGDGVCDKLIISPFLLDPRALRAEKV
jgi:hypothetical protein